MAGSDICAMFCSCNWLSLCFHDCPGVWTLNNSQKRMVVPAALSVLKLKPGCRVSTDLSNGSWWLAVCVDSFGFVDFSFVLWDVSLMKSAGSAR